MKYGENLGKKVRLGRLCGEESPSGADHKG